VPITPRRVLSFRASQVLKARINGETPPRSED
jgi:integration host factor subunit alpha